MLQCIPFTLADARSSSNCLYRHVCVSMVSMFEMHELLSVNLSLEGIRFLSWYGIHVTSLRMPRDGTWNRKKGSDFGTPGPLYVCMDSQHELG